MESDWNKTTLGAICSFQSGSVFPKKYQGWKTGEIPFVKVSDMNLSGNERYLDQSNNWISKVIQEKINAKIHPVGAVVFAKIGVALTYNRRRIVVKPTIIDNNMMSAHIIDNTVDSIFFYYLLLLVDFNLVVSGTALPYLNISDLRRIEVTVPSLCEQRAIAHILGSLDDKIEHNRRMNETLEAMAQALFKSWFVNFDPVIDNALAAGNPIPETLQARAALRKNLGSARKPLPDHIRRLFPTEFRLTKEMGYIPAGWDISTIGNEFDVVMGQSPPGATYNEDSNGTPFFQGRADFNLRYPSNRIYCTEPKRFAQKGDTLVSVRAPVGDINMAWEDSCIGRGLGAVRHKSGSRSFTYYSMLQLKGEFKKFEAEGTVFGSIGQQDFKAVKCLNMNEQSIEIFDQYAEEFDQKIEECTNNTVDISILRDALLPRLLSGEIRIPEAQQLMRAST